MTHPTYLLLHVADPLESGRFYGDLLRCAPVESAPTFVLFALETGLKLGLWSREGVEPASAPVSGSVEICIRVDDRDAVDATFADWKARGVTMLMEPVEKDFGRTFVASDPDGHRLRVFAPAEDLAQPSAG